MRLRVLVGAFLALLAAPLQAGQGSDVAAALRDLQADDTRLQSIGWRLAHANAPYCADSPLLIGLQLLDARNFADPPAIRGALRIEGDIAVDAVAKDSPAERAGLRAGEEVLAIGDLAMASLPQVPPGDYARLAGLHDRIEQELARAGTVRLKLRGGDGAEREIAVTGEPACRSRFEISTSGKRGLAEGSRVVINRDSLAENADDAQAATLVAHELAHNILRHRLRLDASGRSAAAVLATEREADRLAPWLVANAGYDPEGASRFAGIWLRGIDKGLFNAPTHDGWKARLALICGELALIGDAQARHPGGKLDWRPRFNQAASARSPATAAP